MRTVWMKDAEGQDRFVLSNLNPSAAEQLVKNLQNILPGAAVWDEND